MCAYGRTKCSCVLLLSETRSLVVLKKKHPLLLLLLLGGVDLHISTPFRMRMCQILSRNISNTYVLATTHACKRVCVFVCVCACVCLCVCVCVHVCVRHLLRVAPRDVGLSRSCGITTLETRGGIFGNGVSNKVSEDFFALLRREAIPQQRRSHYARLRVSVLKCVCVACAGSLWCVSAGVCV
jgi:hypothetical protein